MTTTMARASTRRYHRGSDCCRHHHRTASSSPEVKNVEARSAYSGRKKIWKKTIGNPKRKTNPARTTLTVGQRSPAGSRPPGLVTGVSGEVAASGGGAGAGPPPVTEIRHLNENNPASHTTWTSYPAPGQDRSEERA